MPDPRNDTPQTPDPKEPPMPAPTWAPQIDEPEPDLLPDEVPTPNPDESRDPPMQVRSLSAPAARR